MTRERAFELGTEAAAWHPDLDTARRIAKAILTAVAEENEACAKIAADQGSGADPSWDGCANHIAGLLRERRLMAVKGPFPRLADLEKAHEP